MSKTCLREVKAANDGWFSTENKRFFNDHSYQVLHADSGKPFLVRHTSAWTDMFGAVPRPHYRVNPIDPETLKILPLIDDEFATLEDVKTWLKTS